MSRWRAPAGSLNIGDALDPRVQWLRMDAPLAFGLDGWLYGCLEGFWQSLRFPEGAIERAQVAAVGDPDVARHMGDKAPRSGTVWAQGHTYKAGSAAHHALLERAMRAALASEEKARSCLSATLGQPLVYVTNGTLATARKMSDRPDLPAWVWVGLWVKIRSELEQGELNPPGDLPDPELEAIDLVYVPDLPAEQLPLF